MNQPKVATEAAERTECLACRGLIDVREGWITMTSDGKIGILCSKCRARSPEVRTSISAILTGRQMTVSRMLGVSLLLGLSNREGEL